MASQSVKELKAEAKRLGLTGFSAKKKSELAAMIASAGTPASSSTADPAPTDTVIPSYSDFFAKSSKAKNDAANDRRESYLESLYNMVLADDAPPQLCTLKSEWCAAVDSLCPVPFASVQTRRIGGRGSNFDYLIDFNDESGACVHSQKAEFKHGADSITGLPQFLSLAAKDLPFPQSYAEFYYDRFLPAYIATDSEIIAPPDRDTYLKMVHGSNYNCHPFFASVKARESIKTDAKHAIVNESIRTYLETYASSLDLAHLGALLTAKQVGKAFLLWDMTNFHVAHLTAADLTPTTIRGVVNGNTIVVGTATHTLKLLLRWKNHKGVLYPAWQIGLA
jgi:hypothetical protein